jgi:hypothetical protein
VDSKRFQPVLLYKGGTSSIIDPVKKHELHQNRMQNRIFCQDLQEANYSNAWNQNFGASTQMACTHSILNESHIPKDDREKAVAHKIQQLYTVLEECLNM